MKVHEEHKSKGPSLIRIALIVVSTSRYKEKSNGQETSDKTIPLVRDLLTQYPNITLMREEIVPDSRLKIEAILNELIGIKEIDAIIFSGGTGLSPKDITFETVQPQLLKEISGFGELFRYLSYEEIGSSAMLSRATGGIISRKVVFLLPGSPNAVKLALNKLIFPELKHMVYIANKKE